MVNPVSILTACAAFAMALPAQALTVYSNDFDVPAIVGGGASANFVAGTGGVVSSIAPFVGTYGKFFRGASVLVATELTLNNLPVHKRVDVGFVLAFLDSWDSRNPSAYSPDNFDLYIDGAKFASYTYNNALGTIKDIGRGRLIAEYVQFDSNIYFTDTVADMAGDPGLAFAHSGSTLTLGFVASGRGWQGEWAPGDEAWGVDNLHIDVLDVPEPPAYALMLAGVAGLAAVGWRHRRRRPRATGERLLRAPQSTWAHWDLPARDAS